MKEIEVTVALQYTKDLTLLYVEDDKELQIQTAALFEPLFKSVVVTSNGKEALDAYMLSIYDVVISDIRMPIMDGLELAKMLKEININQAIIITSAYNESEYLLKLINLNINQFILKPINKNNLITTLYEVSKNIVNTKMVESYRKELELKNVSLKDTSDELQSLVRILDSKLAQLSSITSSSENLDYDVFRITKEHLDELKELETDISGALVLISLSKNINVENIQILGTMFYAYGDVLSNYDNCSELTQNIELLAGLLDKIPENFIKRIDAISIPLESFIYVLKMWRKNLLEDEVKKAFELHTSMLNDISTIISIIEPKKEFF